MSKITIEFDHLETAGTTYRILFEGDCIAYADVMRGAHALLQAVRDRVKGSHNIEVSMDDVYQEIMTYDSREIRLN